LESKSCNSLSLSERASVLLGSSGVGRLELVVSYPLELELELAYISNISLIGYSLSSGHLIDFICQKV
jgi:putative ribosome biogenesis GTPase RsgA